ncbi:hypothetical protein [Lactobacillus helveticus]|uniref:hypothetical protein n=1 Tax=Lactobacillus helveticus TaxID=1587 RepID=UPI0020B69C12|nr:hypothetical protein [Lactobacillus helveticus]
MTKKYIRLIYLTLIAAGFLLLGYVVMPASEKLALIIVLPIEATLLSILRHHILEWRIISAREKDVQRHVAHYNLNVKLQTYKPTIMRINFTSVNCNK